MSYNNSSITYDALGNPTTYLDNTLTWEKGRQLKSYGSIASFEYNGQGIRTKKTTNNLVTEYFLDGTKILAQNDKLMSDSVLTENLMEFLYGIDGVIGFKLNNNSYYYKKNLQGDIIGIYNSDLQLIAKYAYDAWGNHKISYLEGSNFVDFNNESSYTNTSNNNLYIALKNPFRYRSYYYDQETSLYYLNSRYYDPRTGRFINVDDISILDITNIALNGINLYSYCLNDPVNEIDNSGNLPDWLKWLIGGLALIGAVILTVVTGGSLTPVFIGMGTSILGSGIIQGSITAINGDSFWNGFVSGAADGAMWGGIFAFAGAAINTIRYFSSTTKLYRAVSVAEFNDIAKTGKFLSRGFSEGKYFATTKNNAKIWGARLSGVNNYKLVKVRVSKKLLKISLKNNSAYYFDFLDTIGKRII